MPIVYSTHPLHPNAARRLDGHADLVIASDLTPDTLAREARPADIVIVRANLPDALFAGAPKLKAAIRHGAGLDMIPLEAATAAGVLVANVPGVNARSVAEHVIFAALALDTEPRQCGDQPVLQRMHEGTDVAAADGKV